MASDWVKAVLFRLGRRGFCRETRAVCGGTREHAQPATRDRIALNAAVFYPALLAFAPEHREPLLDFQQRAATRHPVLTAVFDGVHGWIGRRLSRAVSSSMSPAQALTPPTL